MIFTVYALFDNRWPEVVRYVGFSGKPEKRLQEHLNEAMYLDKDTRKLEWIRKVLSEGSSISFMILEITQTKIEAGIIERAKIAEYKALGHPLVNGTHGGDGATAWAKQETRHRQSEVMKEYWASPEGDLHRQINVETNKRVQTGLKRTDEAKDKMRVAKLGKPHARQRTPEWNAKIAAAQAGKKRRPWTEEERARHAAGQNHEKMSQSAKARNDREQATNCINQRKAKDQFQNLPSQQEWMANPAK